MASDLVSEWPTAKMYRFGACAAGKRTGQYEKIGYYRKVLVLVCRSISLYVEYNACFGCGECANMRQITCDGIGLCLCTVRDKNASIWRMDFSNKEAGDPD